MVPIRIVCTVRLKRWPTLHRAPRALTSAHLRRATTSDAVSVPKLWTIVAVVYAIVRVQKYSFDIIF